MVIIVLYGISSLGVCIFFRSARYNYKMIEHLIFPNCFVCKSLYSICKQHQLRGRIYAYT